MRTIKELIKLEECINGPRVKAVIRGKVIILHKVLELIDELKPTMAINSREEQVIELVKEELKARIKG